MIEYIQLRNFQSHKESELEFHPGVNVLIGESDQGKTAIMRAFYWLMFGRPSGDSICRHGAKGNTEVTVETAHHQISRIRGKGINQYIVDDEIMTGFGQSVPKPVTDILNINELNFMRQLDPPFLFSKTAGEVAQYLNRLINLDVIDSSLSNIKRMHSQSDSAARAHLTESERLQHTLEQYNWIDDADADIAKLERQEVRLGKLKRGIANLVPILQTIYQQEQILDASLDTKDVSARIEKMESTHTHIAESKALYNTLRSAILNARTSYKALCAMPATKGVEKAIGALEQRVAKLGTAQGRYNKLHRALTDVQYYAKNKQESIAEHTRSALLLKQHIPETCPLCEQPIRRKQ